MTKRTLGGTSRKRKRVSGFRVRMRTHALQEPPRPAFCCGLLGAPWRRIPGAAPFAFFPAAFPTFFVRLSFFPRRRPARTCCQTHDAESSLNATA